jgi:PAS domain S-box-containing protein
VAPAGSPRGPAPLGLTAHGAVGAEKAPTRRTGIDLIGNAPWGTHFCQFYQTPQDLAEILVPYFKAGLRDNEFCMWITSEPLSVAEARAALAGAMPNADDYIRKGQLEILDYTEWYTAGGRFEAGRVLQGWAEKERRALGRGFDGLRLTGNTFWLEEAQWRDFADYEAAINDVIGQHRMMALCTYSIDKCGAYEILDVVGNHQFALVKQGGQWRIIQNIPQQRAAQAVRRSEERLAHLIHSTAAGLVIYGPDGKVLMANAAAEDILGLAQPELIGKGSADPAWRFLREDGTAMPSEEYPANQVIATGRPIKNQVVGILRPSEREPVWALINSVPTFDAEGRLTQILCTSIDITDRKRAEEALRQARDGLEHQVRERTAALQRLNKTLQMIVDCNEAMVRLVDENDLLREVCRTIVQVGGFRMAWVGFAEQDKAKTVRPVAAVGFEEGYLGSVRISWADNRFGRGPTGTAIRTGQVRMCRNFATDASLAPWRREALKRGYRSSIALPLTFAGRAFGALTIYAEQPEAFDEQQVRALQELADDLAFGIMAFRTQAERDQALRTLEQRGAQLRRLAFDLTQAEQRERQRLARILHDHLQQLLVGAKFNVGVIKTRTNTKVVRQTAQQVVELLDEAIRESRSLCHELSPPVLYEAGLGKAFEWLGRQMLEKHGLRVQVKTEGAVEPMAEPIRIFLFHAVRELLFNAVKHARAARARVHLTSLGSDRVQIVVEDKGAGFNPAQIDSLAVVNSGFGLFSIRERLNILGGSLQIASAPGRGSRFTLVAPLQAPAGVAVAAPEAVAEAAHTIDEATLAPCLAVAADKGRKIRIILADDHKVMRQGLARLLSEQPDIEIVGQAGDGRQAVDLVRDLQPNVVLMDITMPRMGGIQATRIITTHFPNVRVIGLSMHEEADMAAAMCEAGAIAYLNKGDPPKTLLAAIRGSGRAD